jgi:hypothetical protein
MSRLTLADLPARYQAQVTGQTKPAPAAKPMLRQSAAPKLNTTEAAWGDYLRATLPSCPVLAQAITLRLANGCRYTPDFAQVTQEGIPAFYEVKGFMRDDAAVKIKVAAAQFPAWAFWLVWRKAGQWQQQRVLA